MIKLKKQTRSEALRHAWLCMAFGLVVICMGVPEWMQICIGLGVFTFGGLKVLNIGKEVKIDGNIGTKDSKN